MSEAEEKKGIKTGALRRAYDDALEKNIICTVQLLISIASMQYWKEYGFTAEDKLKVARVLKENGYDAEYIQLINPQIDKKYFPTNVQIKKLLEILDGDYQYQDDFIKYSLLKSVNQEDLTGKKATVKKIKRLSAQDLKRYIYETEQIEYVLEEMGFTHIKYHSNAKIPYFSCCNIDGDNPSAVNVKNNEYLGVKNYTKKGYDDKSDIFTLIECSFAYSFNEAYLYLSSIVDLTDKEVMKEISSKQYKKDDETEKVEKPVEPFKFYDESILKKDYYYPFMDKSFYNEGITEEARKRFGVLLSCHHVASERGTVIPLRHYETGKLLGISLRRNMDDSLREILGVGKYDVTYGYSKLKNVYGLWENKDTIKEAGCAIIFESEKSPMKLFSRGDGTGVAIQGSVLSDEQVNILTDLNVDLIVSMDADVSLDKVKEMCKRLYDKNKGKVYYTVDNHGLMGVKDSIADLPKADYDLIFSEKVLYEEI